MTRDRSTTRRRFVKLSGAAVAATAGGAGTAVAEAPDWEAVRSPVDATLYDVETTARNEFAVGGAGIVVERAEGGWTKVVDGGPSGNGNDLYGADVTDDGKRVWFVGASGAIGEYDVETGNLEDRSAPNDHTNNFQDIAVTGEAGEANVYVGDGSGSVHYSFENGASGTWNYVTVGQGAAIRGLDFHGDRTGHLINGNANAFYTGDGTTWNRIGVADSDVSFYGIDSDARYDVWVAAGSGVVYNYRVDAEGTPKWFRTRVGEPTLRDIELTDGDGYAVGNSGAVFDRESGSFSRDGTPNGQTLTAVVDQENNDIAVGASGTIIETNPDAEAESGSEGGSQDADAGRIARVATGTSESKRLTFTMETVGDRRVAVDSFTLETDTLVDTIARSGAEVTIEGDATGTADSPDGFAVDGELTPLDDPAALDPGTRATADFGAYDSGNVALTVEPVDRRPDGDYISATLAYGDGASETFYFAVTNVNS